MRFDCNTLPLELIFWTFGLLFLYFIPSESADAINLCIYRLIGFDHCPGCGLGESISLLLHGELARSVETHFIGPFALAVILHRMIVLVKQTPTIARKEHAHA